MLRVVLCMLVALTGATLSVSAQESKPQQPSPALEDYSKPERPFPQIFKPYLALRIPDEDLTNAANVPMEVQDGKLQLSMTQFIAAVIENNLTIASARWYPAIAQTELLRAKSGGSPRGVDQAVIPSLVFAGSEGSSILGTAGGSGSGSSNPGGITGTAGAVSISPSGTFDPRLIVSFSHDQTASPLNTLVVAGLPIVKTQTLAFSTSYGQAFSSGTSFTFSYGFQRQGSTQENLLFNPAVTPGFTVTLSQQLLNGFGPSVNRALIKVAENEEQIERESFRLSTITELVTAEDAYWDFLATQETVRAAQQALTVAEELERETGRQLQLGSLTPLDLVTAESQVAAAGSALIAAQTNLQKSDVQLKHMFTTRLEEPVASATLVATEKFPDAASATLPDLDEASAIAEENRPELRIAEGNIKSDEDVRPFMTNALLPSVNAFVLVTNAGLYDLYGTAFTEAIQFKYPEYAFGLTISFPFHNRQAQADEVRSRLELQQAKTTLVQSQSNVDVDVQNAIIAIQQSRQQVMAAAEATRLAEETFNDEEKKLENGFSTVYNVILQQRGLFSAQLAEVQADDSYAKARVQLDEAQGLLLEKSHISVDDALKGRVIGVTAP